MVIRMILGRVFGSGLLLHPGRKTTEERMTIESAAGMVTVKTGYFEYFPPGSWV